MALRDELTALLDTPELLGRRLNSERKRHGLTTLQLARLANVTSTTIRRWEAGENHPSPDKLEIITSEFERIEKKWTSPVPLSPSNAPPGPHLAMLNLDEILRRQALCERVVIIKTLLPFKAGWDGYTREFMVEAMERENPKLEYDFIFPSTELLFGEGSAAQQNGRIPISQNPPRDSFARFKQTIWTHHPDIAHRVRGWEIFDALQALQLQLGAAYGALVVLEYDQSRQDLDKKFRLRARDLVVECPVAAYESEESHHLRESEESCWLELPAHRRDALWALLEEQLGLLSSKCDEFLADEETCRNYKTPAIIPT